MIEKIVLEIDDIDIDDLRAYYENLIASDEAKIKTLQSKVERNRAFINKLGSNGHAKNEQSSIVPEENISTPEVVNGYDKNASWLKKFRYILERDKKAISLSKGLDEMRKHEPIGSGMEPEFRKIQARLSSYLKIQVDDERLKRVKSENGQFVYGYPDWFNKDGSLKEQYK